MRFSISYTLFIFGMKNVFCVGFVENDGQNQGHSNEWVNNGIGHHYEYVSNVNPTLPQIKPRVFGSYLHEKGKSRIIPLDLSFDFGTTYPMTSPNLMASFIRIKNGEVLSTNPSPTTSQLFYIIRGNGSSVSRNGTITWKSGDLFVVPYFGFLSPVCKGEQCIIHSCVEESLYGGCAIYWVHDGPLLSYLGVLPNPNLRSPRFTPTFFKGFESYSHVMNISKIDTDTGKEKNRRGILFGNSQTVASTKTITPSLWSLLNVIDAKSNQVAHRHNSVALDLVISVDENDKVWTSMGLGIDKNGNLIGKKAINWKSGSVFVTPPGWWHSHHNDGSKVAWVLPIQDAGLHTYMRTLDIRFADEEALRLKEQVNLGSTYNEM